MTRWLRGLQFGLQTADTMVSEFGMLIVDCTILPKLLAFSLVLSVIYNIRASVSPLLKSSTLWKMASTGRLPKLFYQSFCF